MAFDRSTPCYYFPQLWEFTPTYNLLLETFTPPISDRMSETAQDTVERLKKHQEKILPLLQGPTLQITILCCGFDRATWTIPKALLSHYSEYFKQICSAECQEGQQHVTILREIFPKAFQKFVQWMYFDTAPIRDMDPGTGTRVWDQLRAWALGIKLKATGFKHCVLSGLFDAYSMHNPTHSQMQTCVITWCGCAPISKSPLRAFLIHTLAEHWIYANYIKEDIDHWMQRLKEYPEVQAELLQKMAGMRAGRLDEVEFAPLETFLEK